MRKPAELSHAALAAIVEAVQQVFYLDFDRSLTKIWNLDKEWDGAEICDQLAAVLAHHDLAPQGPTPITPGAP